MSLTTTDLIEDISTRAAIPNNQDTFTQNQILRYADDETRDGVVPFLITVKEDYLVSFEDITLVANRQKYRIPSRAVGNKVRDLFIVDTGGNLAPLPRIEFYQKRFIPQNLGTYAYNFRGDWIELNPIPTSSVSDKIRAYYYRRPNRLVLPSQAGVISAINTSTKTLTLSSGIGNFTPSNLIDIVSAKASFLSYGDDLAITTVAGNDIVLTDDIPDYVEVGDYVCLAGTTPVPQLPVEMHALLAQRVAIKILEAQGDDRGARLSQAKLEEAEKALQTVVSPRDDGLPQKIIAPDDMYGGSGRRWW